MPPLLSNFDPATTPGYQTTAVAVVSAVIGGTRVALGATKGGAGFNDKSTFRPAEWDSKRHNVVGASGTAGEYTGYASEMSATIVELGPKTIAAALPGATNTGGVLTPMVSNLAIGRGSMLTLPQYSIALKGGTILVIEADFGLVTDWPIDTKDKDEASLKFTIMCFVDGTRVDYSPNLPDYRVFYTDAAGATINPFT